MDVNILVKIRNASALLGDEAFSEMTGKRRDSGLGKHFCQSGMTNEVGRDSPHSGRQADLANTFAKSKMQVIKAKLTAN